MPLFSLLSFPSHFLQFCCTYGIFGSVLGSHLQDRVGVTVKPLPSGTVSEYPVPMLSHLKKFLQNYLLLLSRHSYSLF